MWYKNEQQTVGSKWYMCEQTDGSDGIKISDIETVGPG